MLRWIVSDLLRRGQRWWTLVFTLVVASAGFSLLTAQSATSRLDVVGTVEANARAAYDILVRPAETRLPLEEKLNLVQPGFLNSYETGITLDQWHAIQRLAGVEVAAPIAIVGWATPYVDVTIDLSAVTASLGDPTLLQT